MGFFKKMFEKKGRIRETPQDHGVEEDAYYEAKVAGLERVLGKMNNIVGHAIIPFEVGGAVDMYYFSDCIPGTGFATMELLDSEGNGPKPNKYGTYELVAFTRQPFNRTQETPTAFDKIERRFCGIFTRIGNYSFDAVLNPTQTCELPGNSDSENKYLVFDLYQPDGKEFIIGQRKHHLLLCIEIFKTEIEFAWKHGGDKLLAKLRESGHYPYSDLSRDIVV
ncbi:MAG: suppressor of fused domain protein [Bacteroidetes bacterium]|nr:suppressor of fused domain protein [Bacteroidota bacterium]